MEQNNNENIQSKIQALTGVAKLLKSYNVVLNDAYNIIANDNITIETKQALKNGLLAFGVFIDNVMNEAENIARI